MIIRMLMILIAFLTLGAQPVRADDEHGPMSRQPGGHGRDMQESGGHFIRHLLAHAKEIGLTADQVTKLKAINLDLARTRIKTESEIKVAELELADLLDNEKAGLDAIEGKVKQSEMLEVGLRMAAINAKREALALLTPAQREKEKVEHEKMMRQMGSGGMMGGMGGGMMGGMMEGGMMGRGGHDAPAPGQPRKGEEKQDEHRH
jgi:Spy/CpxP family protein refolding chaperone